MRSSRYPRHPAPSVLLSRNVTSDIRCISP